MIINLQELRDRKQYITERYQDGLFIWNYNTRCQIDKAWDEYTMMCRGLITDDTGLVVARPFPKFFNYSEHDPKSQKEFALRSIDVVCDKMDGSLGILYKVADGDYRIATRGSFDSEQARWATDYLREMAPIEFDDNLTYLFEIIYPENRVVVDYKGLQALVLLATVNKDTGEIDGKATHPRFKRPETGATGLPLDKVVQLVQDEYEGEGVVVYFKDNHMLKMKTEEYLRLHKIRTNLTNIDIWEALRTGTSRKLLETIPDEMMDKVAVIETELIFEMISAINTAMTIRNSDMFKSRAEYAKFMDGSRLAPIVFALLDNRFDKAEKIAWKLAKPKERKLIC